MKKRTLDPTLSDVARTAGVGVGTASRAINGGVNVSPATLKKVEAAIRRLGYVPNHAARILKGGRTKTVGLLVPSIADSFFAHCAEAAEEVARSHDSLLIVAVTGNEPENETTDLAVLMRHRPDGLLIVPSGSPTKQFAALLKQAAVPIVTFDRPLPDSGCIGVITDNYQAARNATVHLIEHGYKRILCFGGEEELYTICERLRGYRDAMKGAKLPRLIDTKFSGEGDSAVASLKAHLAAANPPDAIFSLKNSTTIATFQALEQLKVPVPGQVALLGFDDFELAGTLRPAVTVVEQPVAEVGRRAAELLFGLLARPGGASARVRARTQESVMLASRLVTRASCGCHVPAGG